MPPVRPSAFEASFGEKPAEGAYLSRTQQGYEGADVEGRLQLKRKQAARDAEAQELRLATRPRLDLPEAHYVPRNDPVSMSEEAYSVLMGDGIQRRKKPTRLLRDFTFFDTTRQLALVSLSALDVDERRPVFTPESKHMEAVGHVTPVTANDEDAGQEDDLGGALFVRLTPIQCLRTGLVDNTPHFVVETRFAAYVLLGSSAVYRSNWDAFLTPARRGRLTPPPRRAPRDPSQLEGNKDLAVLAKENLQRTTVTPLIYQLARDVFDARMLSEFVIIGPPEREGVREREQRRKEKQIKEERVLLMRALRLLPEVWGRFTYEKVDRYRLGYFASRIVMDNRTSYKVGDTVLARAGAWGGKTAPDPPKPEDLTPETRLFEYFWIGRVLKINIQMKTMHLQWYQAASDTTLGEFADRRELFFTHTCDDWPFNWIIDHVDIVTISPKDTPPATQFFVRWMFDFATGACTDIPPPAPPPDTNACTACAAKEAAANMAEVVVLEKPRGFAYMGARYHQHDCVLVRTEDGPCDIGQIVDVDVRPAPGRRRGAGAQDEQAVRVRLFGRIGDVRAKPTHVLKDERHLFLTDTETLVDVRHLLGHCRVLVVDPRDAYARGGKAADWLARGPDRFVAAYVFPDRRNAAWADHRQLQAKDVPECEECARGRKEEELGFGRFLRSLGKGGEGQGPLRAFDPFAGCGAFGMAMEEVGIAKVTHAVEISPSAAATLRESSPHTTVYNQCSNIIFQHAIKTRDGLAHERPRDIRTGKHVAAPPQPGQFDLVLAGWPCQSHSRLNMYKNVLDVKSHLVWNALSWVHFLQPKYCVFENVRGFLSYRTMATQDGKHRVEGGVEMGGLKFVLRVLGELGYQYRFALLQAGHYGSPQSRVRFFLLAAKHGLPLPAMPQPTHHFPVVDALRIQVTYGRREEALLPILTAPGTAPCPMTTIEDAIGDLKRWDYARPKGLRIQKNKELAPRFGVPLYACDPMRDFWGPYDGDLADEERYEHMPHTACQRAARTRPIKELQHFTRPLPVITAERVRWIPMNSGADYRSLPQELWEYQSAHHASAQARRGFPPGMYGRLDKDGHFNTTVTNVLPTAKQSWVLHPYCRRMLTVRELARSQGFPDWVRFTAIDYAGEDGDDEDDDEEEPERKGKSQFCKTMHRQIGNAVPWPVAAALARELRTSMFTEWKTVGDKGKAAQKADKCKGRQRDPGLDVIVID